MTLMYIYIYVYTGIYNLRFVLHILHINLFRNVRHNQIFLNNSNVNITKIQAQKRTLNDSNLCQLNDYKHKV